MEENDNKAERIKEKRLRHGGRRGSDVERDEKEKCGNMKKKKKQTAMKTRQRRIGYRRKEEKAIGGGEGGKMRVWRRK